MTTNTAGREPAWSVKRPLLAPGAYVSRAGTEGIRELSAVSTAFVKRH